MKTIKEEIMNKSIACISTLNKKIFIAKRINVGDMGGKWEFPGGKVEENEDSKPAIKREMIEEFGVNTEILDYIASSTFVHREKERILEAYLISFEHDGIEKPFVLTEHTEYMWIEPEKIPELDFVDSDLKIYPSVIKYLTEKKLI